LRLGSLPAWTRLGIHDSCLETLEALGSFADGTEGEGIEQVHLRIELRALFKRIAHRWKRERTALVSTARRAETLAALRRSTAGHGRNRLIEYHALCRFEQLTDLGFLVKETPSHPATSLKQRRHLRAGWGWHVTPGLVDAASIL